MTQKVVVTAYSRPRAAVCVGEVLGDPAHGARDLGNVGGLGDVGRHGVEVPAEGPEPDAEVDAGRGHGRGVEGPVEDPQVELISFPDLQ